MKNLHTFEEFLNESLNESKDEIVFSIDDDKLDQMLNSRFSRQLDYKDDGGDSFYVLGRKDFDRFIDLADSSGFDVDYENSEDSVISVQESLNEAMADPIRDIHFEIDPKKQEELKITYGKSTGAIGDKSAIDAADYMLKKFRKENKFGDGSYVGIFLPGSYDAIHSKLGDGPHAKAKRPSIQWNQKEYDKWCKAYAGNGGADHAFDMAQNAKNEPGLIDFVRKNNPGEDPLEVIQWAIETYA